MPDSNGTVTSAVASDDTVALEVRWEGTLTGSFGDFQPTGKRQVTPAALLFSFADDQIKEFHQYFDSMALYEQLGLTAQ
jgi:predicted ester cyclase